MPPEIGLGELLTWAILAAVPIGLIAATCFTKIAVVLSALRVGLSAEALLPMGVIVALAVVLTAIVMGPTGGSVYGVWLEMGAPTELAAFTRSDAAALLAPWGEFLRAGAHPEELRFFGELAAGGEGDPRALVAAFMVSELVEALTMVVLLLVPFVLIDLIVAQLFALLEMGSLPVAAVALPAKILLFLAAGGWRLVLEALLRGYA